MTPEQTMLADRIRAGLATEAVQRERSMGPGWIRVDAAAVADDLEGWLAEAMVCNRRLTGPGGR